MGFIYFRSKIYVQSSPVIQPPLALNQFEYYTLPYKYPQLLPLRTGSEMFLIICEWIDKLCYVAIRLNKVIADKCIEHPPKADRRISPTLMPRHPQINFQPRPKVDIKVRLHCILYYIFYLFIFIEPSKEENLKCTYRESIIHSNIILI